MRQEMLLRLIKTTKNGGILMKYNSVKYLTEATMFLKIGVLKNFAMFTRKPPCWSLLLIKLQVLLKPKFGMDIGLQLY